MQVGDVMQPVAKAVTSSYTVATAAARHMVKRGTGVILVMAGGREAIPNLGGSHVAWAALAGLCRQFAAELGPQGVRVAWLLSPGSRNRTSQIRTPRVCCCHVARVMPMSRTLPSSPRPTGPRR
ncbi:SDR family oxidoreductase [Rhodococcus koreensis]